MGVFLHLMNVYVVKCSSNRLVETIWQGMFQLTTQNITLGLTVKQINTATYYLLQT